MRKIRLSFAGKKIDCMEKAAMTEGITKHQSLKTLLICISLTVGLVYFFSNPNPQNYYDYTFRVADNILRGEIAFREKPPSWLNEFVPFEGHWYSVFPLGSVLTMLPFAFFKLVGLIDEMPAAFISALSAAAVCFFLLLISLRYSLAWEKRILLAAAVLFGTWMWANETIGGAWQLALGWAMVGELGAIYFAVYDRRPFLAGVFFALAFGNRTEILLTAPFFMFLLFHERKTANEISVLETPETERPKTKKKKKRKTEASNSSNESPEQELKLQISNLKSGISQNRKEFFLKLSKFCAVPFVLGVLTLAYNYVRFRSFTDFGYARIPGVLNEPWYNHGIFSYRYIPRQAYEMLLKPWESLPDFPYLVPDAFSSSILWSSPFLFLLLRPGARDRVLVFCAWTAILVLTLLLWMHGNSGGWQFGYRYAMVLLPWVFVILLENSPKKITVFEAAACGVSFLLNIYSVYLFHWTEYMKR